MRVEKREALEVYVSETGNICIKQEDYMGEKGNIVCLAPEQVPQIAKWLYECLKQEGYPKSDISSEIDA